jgi:hypothetical protein
MMADREQIEKVRQEIMRFRELLTLLREKLDKGERAYSGLFSSFSPEEIAGTKEKDLQWKAAEKLLDDDSALRKAVLQMHFDTREMERAFEELYGIIVTVQESGTE